MRDIDKKLSALREKLEEFNIDAYLIPTNDEFQSEYPPSYAKRLEFISGFTGSYGFLIITKSKAILYTDSRYTTQAENQLDKNLFEIFNITDFFKNEWLKFINLGEEKKCNLGIDPSLFTYSQINKFRNIANIVKIDNNLVDEIWDNQPHRPCGDLWSYEEIFAGESSDSKLLRLREWMKSKNISYFLITNPESVCWLFNVRSSDCDFNTVSLCYALISLDKCTIFSHKREKIAYLDRDSFYDLENICEYILALKKDKIVYSENIALDEEYTNIKISETLGNYKKLSDPCILWKSAKNEIEIANAKKVHIKDSIALCEFFSWLDDNYNSQDEFSLGEKITEFRSNQDGYITDSFSSICGFKSNGAVVHYRAEDGKSLEINGHGLLLIDSGAHYLGGTTDVTRVILIGDPPIAELEKYKKHYSLVLKGHIALSKIIFPMGVCGGNLDILARQFLWREFLDYGHGTGHGVGNGISVHEPPQRINLFDFKNKLIPGMIVSNEPGYYVKGDFGIRIENLQYVYDLKNGFYSFKYLTLVPYCIDLIDFEILSNEEIEFLRKYNSDIKDLVYDHLSEKAKKWVDKNINF